MDIVAWGSLGEGIITKLRPKSLEGDPGGDCGWRISVGHHQINRFQAYWEEN